MIGTVELYILNQPLERIEVSFAIVASLQTHWYFVFLILSLLLGLFAWHLWRSIPPAEQNENEFMPSRQPVRDANWRQHLAVQPIGKPGSAFMLADTTLDAVLAQNHAPACLVVQKTPAGIQALKQFPITKLPFTLGRVDCDLTIGDTHVSRRHAKIVQHDEHFYLIDLRSSNQTFLAGRPVKAGELIPLRPNSTIALGRHTVLRFECG